MRTLLRGATVITMDAQGDLPQGDILVEGDRIARIAPRIEAVKAQVVDATGGIAIPGRPQSRARSASRASCAR